MNGQSFLLWIEAEEWPAGEWTPADAVTDAIVTLDDGTRWVASFCSFAHLATLRANCAESGENLGGKYLWASDLILVDANPLQNVANMEKRSGVMIRGRWLPASEIDARLAKIAAAR